MATEKLFGNTITPSCSYCDQIFQSISEDQLLCMKRGIVPPSYSCKRFRYDPLKRVPPRPLPLEKYSEEDFSLE